MDESIYETKYRVRKLNSRTLPLVTLDLHQSRLFMRESDLAFFVEACLLEVVDDPILLYQYRHHQPNKKERREKKKEKKRKDNER